MIYILISGVMFAFGYWWKNTEVNEKKPINEICNLFKYAYNKCVK